MLFCILKCLCFSVAFFPLHIGDHVYIDDDTIVNAAQIGSYVHIGKNCVIVSLSLMWKINYQRVCFCADQIDFMYFWFVFFSVLQLCKAWNGIIWCSLVHTETYILLPIQRKVTNCFNPLQGRRCVLKDCCAIADNTVLPPETVVPPFTMFSGSPGGHCIVTWLSRDN